MAQEEKSVIPMIHPLGTMNILYVPNVKVIHVIVLVLFHSINSIILRSWISAKFHGDLSSNCWGFSVGTKVADGPTNGSSITPDSYPTEVNTKYFIV